MHQKALNDLTESTWEMQNRKATLEREKTSRMQVLEKVRLSSCVDGSDMEWYISHVISCRKTYGRGKLRNVMITGQANRGKTCMLKPLEIIYNAFSNAANDKYALVAADNAEVITLQDFRGSSELICLKDLLLL